MVHFTPLLSFSGQLLLYDTAEKMGSKVETVLQSLTLEEKISLLAGKDFWETVPVPDKGVPAIKVGLGSATLDLLYSD